MADNSIVCPRCGTAVGAGARFCASCGASTSRLLRGQILDGKYEILEKTGEGGMGEVYKARHVHLDEIRIIKLTKPDPLGEGSEPRRFQEEARIATLVRHPNVAALYDFSRLPDGSYYMVWEFIDGITLEEWLRRHGPLPAARAIDVAQQVLSGLEEIHAQGIVHRDLAPDNIMVRENKSGRLLAKIIDLGIAKRVAAETLNMTGTGMFVGKLKYCSPEQAGALLRGESLDGRSDLYSFGVVLYEMLTGRAPFESQTPAGYLGKHLHAAVPPLDAARLPAAVAPGLASIVTRALEKHRDRRFPDARAFSTALAALPGTGELEAPTAATPWVPGEQARGGFGWLVGGAIALAAVAAAFAVVLHRPAPPLRLPADPTPAPRVLLPTQPADADALVSAPRILEEETPTARPSPVPPPTRVPPAVAAPNPTSTPVPAVAPPAAGPLVLPGIGELTSRKMRRILDDWRGRPIERRANQAVRVAYIANRWVKAYPDDPLSEEIRTTLPKALRDDSDASLNGVPSRPGRAFEFAAAYLQLGFATADPEMERRVNELQRRFKPGNRQRGFARE
jgi:tRNA A-37 threonylcarbamoyl transferase component Bud32